MPRSTDEPTLHPLKVVALRSGLTPDVIRVWERRYRAVSPVRSAGNQRLYSDEDLERVALLARARQLGRSIGHVASLPTAKLRELVASDEASSGQHRPASHAVRRWDGTRSRAETTDAQALIEMALDAARALDAGALEHALAAASLAIGRRAVLERVVAPFLVHVGEAWFAGTLGVAHEHLASVVVHNALAQMLRPESGRAAAPVFVVATPSGQPHELGALLAAVAADALGFRVVYLGPNLPVDDIATAARWTRALAVGLSLVYPADDPRLGHELARLRDLLGSDVGIVAGGRAAAAYGEALARARIAHAPDLKALEEWLEGIRGRGHEPRAQGRQR
jgi:DNA-binding transcriptional MerR regulator/methylmalonyl-CoA mutase cobalamin-binding subunit